MTSSQRPLNIGIVGCGNISKAYLEGTRLFPDLIQIVACSDLDVDRAKAQASKFGVPKACSVDELLADPSIDVVLNLTIPSAHAEVNLAALRAGKNAYCEKPFSLKVADGERVLEEARARKLWVGCAPDTVLGSGIQTCRQLIDRGAIGRPIAAVANMLCNGHEHWHPSPQFYYQTGGGPLFDMGPYYLTALVTMLGPITSVTALAQTTFPERTIKSEPLKGTTMSVEVPTHLVGLLEFAQGSTATVTMSFDVWKHTQPRLEIYGEEGSLQCPDPNGFTGDVLLWTQKSQAWESIPLMHETNLMRGVGLAEMARAIRENRPHRMSGDLGIHIVEVMEAFHASASQERKVRMTTRCALPEAFDLKAFIS